MKIIKVKIGDEERIQQMAKKDAEKFKRDQAWRKHIRGDYNSFKALEGTELTPQEYKEYQQAILAIINK